MSDHHWSIMIELSASTSKTCGRFRVVLRMAGSCVVSVGGFEGAAQPAGPSLPGQGRLRRRYAMPLRGTLDLRVSTAPPGRGYGQARGLPSTTRSTPEPTTDQPRCGTALFPQVTLLDRPARMIMRPYPRKRQ